MWNWGVKLTDNDTSAIKAWWSVFVWGCASPIVKNSIRWFVHVFKLKLSGKFTSAHQTSGPRCQGRLAGFQAEFLARYSFLSKIRRNTKCYLDFFVVVKWLDFIEFPGSSKEVTGKNSFLCTLGFPRFSRTWHLLELVRVEHWNVPVDSLGWVRA